jgi:hypothetical protein
MVSRFALAGVVLLLAGCSSGVKPGGETGETQDLPDVRAEAYLFDTRIDFEGKRRSVRLEVFATDSLIGLGGRAYLGKGALKGWLDSDSLKLYFPNSNEYVYEPVSDLLQSFKCGDETPSVQVLSLFYHRPDAMQLDSHVRLITDTSDANRPTFTLQMADCPWRMTIGYDRRDPGWRVREFEFDNGDDLRVNASRREYRADTDVSAAKFNVVVPADAARIIP